MVNKKLLMTAIFTIAFVAIAAAAASAAVTVKVDTIQANGHYIGTPVLLQDEIYHYGYNYTFVPDGSFTVKGTISNDEGTSADVLIGAGEYGPDVQQVFTVPASSTIHYSLTMPAGMEHDLYGIDVGYKCPPNSGLWWLFPKIDSSAYINAPDDTTHTINEGPMSDAVAIYANGQLVSNAGVIYLINQSSDDYKAMYTSSKLTYSGQPAYTIGLY